jgi:hypothetical protein
MSQLVKTKGQADFEDFKRFGPFKGLHNFEISCTYLVQSNPIVLGT